MTVKYAISVEDTVGKQAFFNTVCCFGQVFLLFRFVLFLTDKSKPKKVSLVLNIGHTSSLQVAGFIPSLTSVLQPSLWQREVAAYSPGLLLVGGGVGAEEPPISKNAL